tara:strand:+ start:3660 stop:4343 length:684 start_codon:yes stop_codon:yes gene_type:complete
MSNNHSPKMHETWLELLNQEFRKPYMQSLREFLIQEKLKNKVVYPPNEETFRALRLTGVDDVKVVILGQDPYHGRSQADGLAFSVQKGIKLPPSLRNIFKEIEDDLGLDSPKHGDLSFLAEQGVLLLNSVLTVNEGDPASHANRGWEAFTDKIVEILDHKKNIVFMLWGGYAQKKASKISKESHCILKATHPSPLSAHRGFFGCRHFSKANEYLVLNGLNPIKWTKP